MNYFSDDELACKHCGALRFDDDFRATLNAIREDVGFALPVSSGYRCPRHPVEARKRRPGAHTTGKGADLQVSGERAYRLIQSAIAHSVKRIGVHQTGPHSERFIHLDDADLPSPVIWSY